MISLLIAAALATPTFTLAHPAVPAPQPSCSPAEVLTAVNASASSYFIPGANAKVRYAGFLPQGKSLSVMVLVDDFDVKNTYGADAEVFVIVGSSLASETTAWIAVANAATCKLNEAWEALHTGGGGL